MVLYLLALVPTFGPLCLPQPKNYPHYIPISRPLSYLLHQVSDVCQPTRERTRSIALWGGELVGQAGLLVLNCARCTHVPVRVDRQIGCKMWTNWKIIRIRICFCFDESSTWRARTGKLPSHESSTRRCAKRLAGMKIGKQSTICGQSCMGYNY